MQDKLNTMLSSGVDLDTALAVLGLEQPPDWGATSVAMAQAKANLLMSWYTLSRDNWEAAQALVEHLMRVKSRARGLRDFPTAETR